MIITFNEINYYISEYYIIKLIIKYFDYRVYFDIKINFHKENYKNYSFTFNNIKQEYLNYCKLLKDNDPSYDIEFIWRNNKLKKILKLRLVKNYIINETYLIEFINKILDNKNSRLIMTNSHNSNNVIFYYGVEKKVLKIKVYSLSYINTSIIYNFNYKKRQNFCKLMLKLNEVLLNIKNINNMNLIKKKKINIFNFKKWFN